MTDVDSVEMAQRVQLAEALGVYPIDSRMSACKKWLAVSSPLFGELVSYLSSHSSVTVHTHILWTKKEMDSALGFFVRGQTMGMSDAEYKVQSQVFDQAEPLTTSSRWGHIKVHPKLQLNTLKLKSGTLRYLDQWTEELLMAADVAASWDQDWSKCEAEPILGKDGKARRDLFRVVTDVIMPEVSENTICHYETWDNGADEASTPRLRGTLTYDQGALSDMPVLARTAEPFGSLSQGLLLASKSWRDWCLQHNWKGPRFIPLLQKDGPLWQQFEDQWALFHEGIPSSKN